MRLAEIGDKSIVCDGCRKRYTINFKKPKKACVSTKKSKCSFCGKHNTTVIELGNNVDNFMIVWNNNIVSLLKQNETR